MEAAKRKYGGTTFPADYNKTFEEFKADFEHSEYFNNIPEKERQAELKKAHGVATGKIVLKPEKPAKNGDVPAAAKESPEDQA